MPTAPTPAFLLWLGTTGLAIVRSLGRRGVPVIAFHHDRGDPSTGTRYADVRILPPLEQDGAVWLAALLDEGRRLGPTKAPLFVASDPAWLFVARHREALSQHFVFPLPDAADVLEWMSKSWQYAAAARAGINCPRTVTPRTHEELRQAADRVAFPCVLKPALSHVWVRHYGQKLVFASNAAELMTRGGAAIDAGIAFSVQEYVPADDRDVYGMFSYVDQAGRLAGACVSRKVRQYEPRFGSSCCSVSVREPRVVELGSQLLQTIGFRGISSVEFKRDRRDGQFKLMEINLRAPLLMAVAIDSGLDIPYIAYRDLVDDPLPPQQPTRFGRRVGIFAHDWFSARFYRRQGDLTLPGWLWCWLRTRDVHFAWDDMGPFRGYVHMLLDQWRRGRLRGLPSGFPTPEQWRAGSPAAKASTTNVALANFEASPLTE